MTETGPRRKLAAILVADTVGFSKMMGENEDRTLKNLKACRTLTDDAITANHGRIFGSAGDSVIAEFGSPVDAIVAATEFQRDLRDRNEGVPEADQMLFRVGLNLGDVIIEGGNSHFKDTEKRAKQLSAAGIHFLGMGVSGGEEGALKGPALMIGGVKEAYMLVKNDLSAIAL